MSKQTQNLSYPEQFLVRRGSIESWGKYIEDYKQKHKVDEYIVPSGQLIAVKETKEDKNYRLKLGNGVDDFYTLSYLDTDLEEKLNQEIQDRITSDEELLANDLVILNEAKQYADDLISGALKRVIVEELPTEDIDLNTIYMVLRPESEPNNIYDEYMYIDDEWEKLGSTEINLNDYYTKDEVDNKITNETNKVFPAVFRDGEISKLKSDYPGIKDKDLVIYTASSLDRTKVFLYVEQSDEFRAIESIKIITSTENPPTYSGGYNVGDIWIKNSSQVFICISGGPNGPSGHPPYNYTWKDLTESGDLSNYYTKSQVDNLLDDKQDTILVGNGLDIEQDRIISVDLIENSGLMFINGQLAINNGELGADAGLRQSLVSTFFPNPLASKSYVDNLMSGATKWEFVSQLPTEDIDIHTIYFVSKQSAETDNIYDEWVYAIQSRNPDVYDWELLGTSQVDLSNYYTKTESDNRYEPKLTLGDGLRKGANDVLQVKLALSEVENPNYIIFDNVNNGLFFDYYTLGYNTSLRANLTSDSYSNPLQPLITSNNKLSADLVDDTSATNKFVPTHSSTESGKVLGVDSNGDLEWTTKGGGSYSGGEGIDITNDTISVDLKSGSKLNFDNGELDVDLSSKQDVIDSNNMLDADLVDDTNTTNKFVSAQEKQGWNDKADDTIISTDTTSTTVSLTLADNHEYRYTQELTSLTLTMPSGDFIASVVFASGSTPTSMTYDSSIKWSGDDVTNGQFVPTEKTYNIVMWYDGLNINGVVRGVV